MTNNKHLMIKKDELSHHGVKGQKWGVLRYQYKDGTRTSLGKQREREKKHNLNSENKEKAISKITKNLSTKAKTKNSEKIKQAKETQAQKEATAKRKKDLKNRRNMSDKELKAKIERLKLEQQYKDMVTSDISAGKKYVNKILMSAGEQALTSAAKGAMSYLIRSAMTKEFNLKEAADYVVPPVGEKKKKK